MRAKGGAQPIGKNQTTLFLYKGPVSIPNFHHSESISRSSLHGTVIKESN